MVSKIADIGFGRSLSAGVSFPGLGKQGLDQRTSLLLIFVNVLVITNHLNSYAFILFKNFVNMKELQVRTVVCVHCYEFSGFQ